MRATPRKDKSLNDLLDQVEKDRRVLAVLLFGSAARKRMRKDSDVDICLLLAPDRYSPLQLSAVRLEYLRDFDLDIQIFHQLPLYIRKRVLKEGKVLFCRDTDGLYDAALAFIREYADYEPTYRSYVGELTRA